MTTYELSESLHRLVKHALDTGEAASLAEAEAKFRGYEVTFSIGEAESECPLHQAALLTGIALARRVFLGGVKVLGSLGVPLRVAMPIGRTLLEGVLKLGGTPGGGHGPGPLITIGGRPAEKCDQFHVRTLFAGWRGGIVPAHHDVGLQPGRAMPLAPMLSAAIAVNEAFLHVGDKRPAAGHRPVGLSLWDPTTSVDWLSHQDEPELVYLPSKLWVIGLGHLGQAYLWGLGLLPYRDPSKLTIVLQDVDRITPSTDSTSVLTDASLIGQMKTRAMAGWAEKRGFSVAIHERIFDTSFQRQDREPSIALCGIDNGLGRRALDHVGFKLVVEAGLGRGHQDFRSIRLHTLPGSRAASELWKASPVSKVPTVRSAYQQLLDDHVLDRCGVTLLAEKAVGAPFVGSVAATLVLAEVLRLLHGGPLHEVVELDLAAIDHRSVVRREIAYPDFNPGFVTC